jgi:hypothetical protein
MQREIKFKEYRGDGKWHFWGLMDEGKFVGPCSPNSKAFQFTGIKDTKGNDIYEGDILKYHLDDGEIDHMPVFFEDGSFMVGKYDKEFLFDDLEERYKFQIEVVSHICQQPQLVSVTRAVGGL